MKYPKRLIHYIAVMGFPLSMQAQNVYPTNGNVGIGTTSPTVKLEVRTTGNNAADAYALDIHNPSTTAWTTVYQRYGTGGALRAAIGSQRDMHGNGLGNGGALLFSTMDAAASLKERMVISAEGNVGVGTLSPAARLHVAGAAQASRFTVKDGWDNVLQSEDQGRSYQLIGTYQGWDPKAVYIAGYHAGNLSTIATEKVFIGRPDVGNKFLSVNLMTGGVGVGTINTADPAFRLFVEGGIRARKVRVDQTAWPDYVFAPTYKLLSLKEVEQYIQHHQHLPDVPSAKEVKESGIDLGDNQALLLKKIEELTLYVIDLSQTVEKQNEVILKQQHLLENLQQRLHKN